MEAAGKRQVMPMVKVHPTIEEGTRKKRNGAAKQTGPKAVSSSNTTDNDEYQTDIFDTEKPIDIATDTCALCNEGHEFGLLLKHMLPQISKMTAPAAEDLGDDEGDEICLIKPSFGDPTEVWISRFGIRTSGKRRVFVHFYCALTSPRCWFTGVEWKNVYREVNRGRSMVCNECGHRGATIGCAVDRCSMVLHLPCAVKQGYQQLRYNLNFYCRDHRRTIKEDAVKAQHQAIQQQGRGTFKQDVSRGTENIPIGYQNVYDKATPLHPNPSSTSTTGNDQAASSFQYVVTNVDSDEVITNNLTVAGTDYCTCVDMCDDVNGGCSCIERGRNYTSQGTLIPDITQRIVECNFKCACSYRRCANRVVQRGLNSRLEIFRSRDELKAVSDWTQVREDVTVSSTLPSSPGKLAQSSASAANSGVGVHGWGVRTLDFIPQYSFVCELMGQWFHLADQDRTTAGNDWAIQARRIRVLGWQEEQDRYEEQERQRMVASFLSSAPAKPKKMKRRRKGDYLAQNTKKKKPLPATPMTVSINSTVLQMNDDSTETEDGGRMQMAGRAGGDALGAVVEEDDDEQEQNELDDDCYFREESPVKGRTSTIVPITTGRAKYLEQSIVNDLCLDCTNYGNIGAFLRRAKPGTRPMFIKKLVFNNNGKDAVPKLALFAARDIEPMTELLL